MPHASFVHLRVHTAYSLSQGAVRIGKLPALCRRHGMPAVAITDSGNLFGALEFSQTLSKAGVQPIVGCDIGVRRIQAAAPRPGMGVLPPDRLLLLVQSEAGYRNLLALVSKSYFETASSEEPQVSLDDISARAEGLIVLTGGPTGIVGRMLVDGQADDAQRVLQTLESAFPGRLYIELQRHGRPVESETEPALVALAYRLDLPLVATNDVHFPDESMYAAHDALLCIAQGRRVDDEERHRLTPDHRFKSAEEMTRLFADLPEAIDNTIVIARRCAFMPRGNQPILPPFKTDDGTDEIAELRRQAHEGLDARLSVMRAGEAAEASDTPYRERLDYELNVIAQMGFAGYFLIVSDFIKWAKSRGIPVGPGRGSGAGSLVAWALMITDLDPLQFGLLFERFLNPERVSMPDFDIDFCQDRRDEVIRYVQERYGQDRVAQIITFGKLQARAVLRDVGRVLGMPYGQVDRICKLVPNNPANPVTLAQAVEREPLLQDMRRDDETVSRLIDIALELEGLYRHASTHAAGVVIGDRPLQELVPLYRDPRSEMPVTQFSMKYAEAAGLVKFDFLGLKTLTVLQHAVELLSRRGTTLDLLQLPLDDAKTYELLASGVTAGVFQLEGAGMRDTLRRLRPNRIEDIIAVVALYRPGPMENIPSYINRKHGIEKPDYLYPTLEPILKETYGIIIYQEQVMQIAQVLSGYSLGGADLLRRAMGKKIKEEMAAQRATFVEGAKGRGVDGRKATEIFDLVDKFAGYGFNKSHAAAYGLIAYQTGYLKANHPVEFMASLMTYDMQNTDKLNAFRQELQRLEVRLLPPDVNRSGVTFTVEDLPDGGAAVRYALAAIKNVGQQAMATIVAERERSGPFADLFDFARRLDPQAVNKRQLENLIGAGALDSLGVDRAQALAAVDMLLRHASVAAEERSSTQVSLFGTDERARAPQLPAVTAWTEAEKLQHELEAIGFYLSAHPVDAYRELLERRGACPISEIVRRVGHAGTARIVIGGSIMAKQERVSARGARFAFVQLSDSSGLAEVAVFSEVLTAARDLLEGGRPVLVTCEARLDGDSLRLTAQKVEDLDRVAVDTTSGIRVFIEDSGVLGRLSELFGRERRGKGRVSLILGLDRKHEVEVVLPGGYPVSPAIAAMVKTLPGVVDVREV